MILNKNLIYNEKVVDFFGDENGFSSSVQRFLNNFEVLKCVII